MLLCDIGNTHLHFYHGGKVWRESVEKLTPRDINEPIYYISVNQNSTKRFLELYPEAKNLAPYIALDSTYKGLGIDRVAACKGVSDGVIVDAGSAITVDIMQNGIHLGGYIMPGITAYTRTFSEISPALDVGINPALELDAIPQNTRDAISYGAINSIVLMIQNSRKSKRLFFTGGDGKFLSRFFENAIFDDSIVFKGMIKTVNEMEGHSDYGRTT
ncbi:MAG: type III pantothenate kinase [Wolinella sp.]